MKDAVLKNGELVCPNCGSHQFDLQRTGKAKVGGYVTLGIGVMLLPKRIKCLVCGEYSKSGNAQANEARAAKAKAKAERRAGESSKVRQARFEAKKAEARRAYEARAEARARARAEEAKTGES